MDSRNPPYTPRGPLRRLPSRPSHHPTTDELLNAHRRVTTRRAAEKLELERRLHDEALAELAKVCQEQDRLLAHFSDRRANPSNVTAVPSQQHAFPPPTNATPTSAATDSIKKVLFDPRQRLPPPPEATASSGSAKDDEQQGLLPAVPTAERQHGKYILSKQMTMMKKTVPPVSMPLVVSVRAPTTARLRDMVTMLPTVVGPAGSCSARQPRRQ